MPDLVGNPEDRFCHDTAQNEIVNIIVLLYFSHGLKWTLLCGDIFTSDQFQPSLPVFAIKVLIVTSFCMKQ